LKEKTSFSGSIGEMPEHPKFHKITIIIKAEFDHTNGKVHFDCHFEGMADELEMIACLQNAFNQMEEGLQRHYLE
jgi:hypothetical protein